MKPERFSANSLTAQTSQKSFMNLLLQTLQTPPGALVIPLLHYVFLQTQLSNMMATLPLVIFSVIIPILRCDDFQGNNPLLMAAYFSTILRIVDIGLMDRSVLKLFSYMEYLEYFFAFKLPEAIQKKTEEFKSHNVDKHCVPYENLTFRYFVNVGSQYTIKYLVYVVIIRHLRNRTIWTTPTRMLQTFSDVSLAIDIHLLGLALALMMEVLTAVGGHFTAFFFKTQYVPIMNAPYFATSTRNFWSDRWNLIVQRGLKRVVFDPTLSLLGIKAGRKAPASYLALASLMTFIVSGLMHEWTILINCVQPTRYEQLLYFTLHGFITITEVTIRKIIRQYAGVDLTKTIPYPVQLLYTHLVLMITAPLFQNPYIREGFFLKYALA
jgi:hypothetical protein